jgi:hypothetical protein
MPRSAAASFTVIVGCSRGSGTEPSWVPTLSEALEGAQAVQAAERRPPLVTSAAGTSPATWGRRRPSTSATSAEERDQTDSTSRMTSSGCQRCPLPLTGSGGTALAALATQDVAVDRWGKPRCPIPDRSTEVTVRLDELEVVRGNLAPRTPVLTTASRSRGCSSPPRSTTGPCSPPPGCAPGWSSTRALRRFVQQHQGSSRICIMGCTRRAVTGARGRQTH